MSESWSDTDRDYMRQAMQLARQAHTAGEVPVGALVVMHGEIVGAAANQTLRDCDPTGHAEIAALRLAATAAGNHRLSDATLYVTLEPCTMCVGGIVQARLRRVVFGAYDRRAGALGSVMDLSVSRAFNHYFEVNGGLFAEECGELLTGFFEQRRPDSSDNQ